MGMINQTYEEDSRELGRIASWLDGFATSDKDSTYLCFLRLLADYRHHQAQLLDNAIEREEVREAQK